jgi:predicted HicB family RNase H-like nuclease
LTQDREGLYLHRHLTEAAQEWERRGQDPSELYRGARLAQAREWTADNAERLNALEQSFLTESIGQEEHETLEREKQRQRELEAAQKLAESERQSVARLRSRNRVITTIGILAILLAALAGTFAFRSDRSSQQALNAQATAQLESQNRATAEANAIQDRNLAQQQSLLASVRELSSQAKLNLDVDPERSILLALQAAEQTYSLNRMVLPEAEDALRRAIQASRVELTLKGHTDTVWWTAFSPDGSRIATASADGTAKIWDAKTGRELITLKGHTGGIYCIAFSPDGKLLIT